MANPSLIRCASFSIGCIDGALGLVNRSSFPIWVKKGNLFARITNFKIKNTC